MRVYTLKVMTVGDPTLFGGVATDLKAVICSYFKNNYGLDCEFHPTENPLIDQLYFPVGEGFGFGGNLKHTSLKDLTANSPHQTLIAEFTEADAIYASVFWYDRQTHNYGVPTGTSFSLDAQGIWKGKDKEAPPWNVRYDLLFASLLQLIENKNLNSTVAGDLSPSGSINYFDRFNCYVSDDIWDNYDGYVRVNTFSSRTEFWKINLAFNDKFKTSIQQTIQPIIDMASESKTKEAPSVTPIPEALRSSWTQQKMFVSDANNAQELPRLYYHHPAFEKAQSEGRDRGYGEGEEKKKETTTEGAGLTTQPRSLISSALLGTNRARNTELAMGVLADGSRVMHAPIIDFDIPITVVPSSQIGHSHLYINKPITWAAYKRILKALASAGLVEEGFVASAERTGFTAVRPIGVQKPSVPKNVRDVVLKNAELTQSVNKLKTSINFYEQKVNQWQKSYEELRVKNQKMAKEHAASEQKTAELELDVTNLKKKVASLEKAAAASGESSSGVALTWD